MDARKKLDEYLRPVLTEAGRKPVHELLDEFAHELAEKQRAFAEQEDAHLSTTSATAYVQGIRDAADLIDPKEKK